MIRNYFKIAWRSLWKHKGYSAINIFGLATGLVALFTVGVKALKAAIANPVKSLRTE